MQWTEEQRMVALSVLQAFESLGGGKARLNDENRHQAMFVVLGRLTAALDDDERRRLDAIVWPEDADADSDAKRPQGEQAAGYA